MRREEAARLLGVNPDDDVDVIERRHAAASAQLRSELPSASPAAKRAAIAHLEVLDAALDTLLNVDYPSSTISSHPPGPVVDAQSVAAQINGNLAAPVAPVSRPLPVKPSPRDVEIAIPANVSVEDRVRTAVEAKPSVPNRTTPGKHLAFPTPQTAPEVIHEEPARRDGGADRVVARDKRAVRPGFLLALLVVLLGLYASLQFASCHHKNGEAADSSQAAEREAQPAWDAPSSETNSETKGYQITGEVTDANGQSLPGVAITLESDTAPKTTVTNELGRYSFADIKPGHYSVTAELGSSPMATVAVAVIPDVGMPYGTGDIKLDSHVSLSGGDGDDASFHPHAAIQNYQQVINMSNSVRAVYLTKIRSMVGDLEKIDGVEVGTVEAKSGECVNTENAGKCNPAIFGPGICVSGFWTAQPCMSNATESSEVAGYWTSDPDFEGAWNDFVQQINGLCSDAATTAHSGCGTVQKKVREIHDELGAVEDPRP